MEYLRHGGQLQAIAKHHGIDASTLIDFSANINPEGPPAAVLKALQAALGDRATLGNYPDLSNTALKLSIAEHSREALDQITVANGFVPLLEAALRALKLQSCILPRPAFSEYETTLDRSGVRVTPVTLLPETQFRYDLGSIFLGNEQAILLANPQNPSGILSKQEDMLKLISLACERNMNVLLDEAFIDYVPEHSMQAAIKNFPKLVVFRSVTKFYAMPGIRVAYCLSEPGVAQRINAYLPPWPIGNLASIAVQAALADRSYAEQTRMLNDRRKTSLLRELRALGLETYEGAANFLFFRLPDYSEPKEFWKAMLFKHQVALRSCENFRGLEPGYLRTAIRSDEENHLMVRALAQQLSP